MRREIITISALFIMLSIACNKPNVSESENNIYKTDLAIIKGDKDDYYQCKQNAFHYFPFLEDIWTFDKAFSYTDSISVGNKLSYWIENNKFFLRSENASDTKKNVLITAEYYTPQNSLHHLIGQGSVLINGENYLQIEEKFSKKSLDATLYFSRLAGKNKKMRFHIEYCDSILKNDTIFAYKIEHNFLSKSVAFSGVLNNSSSSGIPFNQINLIKKAVPSDYFCSINQDLLYTCFKLSNHWLGWELDPLLSKSFTSNAIFLSKTNDVGYGDDDAWLSFIFGTLAGLISVPAGIIYCAIDTYIATHAS